MRLAALKLCSIAFVFLPASGLQLHSQTIPAFRQFDFGEEVSVAPPGFIRITPISRYSREQQFGLLTDALAPLTKDGRSSNDHGVRPTDGLSKEGPIVFRADLPRGRYVVEVTMPGGLLDTWRGEISVNGAVIATRIEPFGTSQEQKYAPPFWASMRECEVIGDSLVVRVSARGQRTSISTICIYPYSEGPVVWQEGSFHLTGATKAPNATLALRLINEGKVTEASRIIDAIPEEWRLDRAFLLMALASKLEAQTPRALVEAAHALLTAEYAATHNEAVQLHIRLTELWSMADQYFKQAGWQWARDKNRHSIFGNCEIAGPFWAEVSSLPQHPLWLSASWNQARVLYWLWREQHAEGVIERADSIFSLIRAVYPHHELIQMYLGDYQPKAPVAPEAPAGPKWAQLQSSLANRMSRILHYWVLNRESELGEFGGKYDDDCEMLRWWPYARVGIDDSVALVGMKKMADGIWNSSMISNGWCAEVRDVEHSAEPVADTQPQMVGFEYGNPVYVERCMQSAKLALDLWTAKNSNGHRHFRSSWYSSTQVDTREPKDCDVPLNARTVKAIRWFAWYTRNPEALRFLREWADSWLEDTKRTDNGKPAWVVPAAVSFSDDAIGGHAKNWHHPALFWDYFNYEGGGYILMEFLACYQLFGDRKYLEPVERSLELVQKHAGSASEPSVVGSEAWAARILGRNVGFWDAVEVWRFLTGNNAYDSIIKEHGSPYLKYRLTGDKSVMEETMADLIRQSDLVTPLMTTEGYFTDRIALADPRGQNPRGGDGASLMESMYLGAPLASLFYPSCAVFWKGTDSTFAALVEESSTSYLRVRVFSNSALPKTGSAMFLQLVPGEYTIVQGKDENGDGKVDRVRKQEPVTLKQANATHALTFVPREEEVIEVKQVKRAKTVQAMCDLAVTASELGLTSNKEGKTVVTIPVHNIGTVDARDVEVELSSNGIAVDSVTLSRIPAPLDLVPRQEKVSFTVTSHPGTYVILVSSKEQVPEITRDNNSVHFALKRPAHNSGAQQ